MQIRVADHSGFCFGVKRAINIAERSLCSSRNIYSLGPIIHNPQVVDRLLKKGLRVIKDIDNLKNGTVIISSHGAPRYLIEKIKKRNIKLLDATCPFVTYAQNIVRALKKEGARIVIVGDRQHPEVRALMSLAGRKPKTKKIGIISQTTQNKDNYVKEILAVLKKDFSEVRIFNTICNDTFRRQTQARRLLKNCDVMVVVGGKNSANTRRLWQICKESGVDSYHIETDRELKRSFFRGKKRTGVVSGASTPQAMVNKVVRKIKSLTKGV